MDLLHQLSYLSAIAAAGIPRSQIFQSASRLPNSSARYFAEVDNLARTMNYEYAEACRIVGENTKEEDAKGLLLRLSGAMASGEPEMDFMNHEAQIQAESYGNVYERNLETLKKWTDAYAALVVSAVLIIVVATVSTLIYDLGSSMVLGLVAVTLAITGIGSWIIYRAAPREVKTLRGPEGHESQRLPRTLAFTLVPASIVLGLFMSVSGVPWGFVLLLAALMIFPVGLAAARYDSRLSKYEADFTTFLRVLGATASAIGTTPAEAMSRIDLRSAPSLVNAIKRLRMRLQSRASLDLCWQRFVSETGSDLIGRTVRTFLDGVRMGGDPEEVGSRASLLAMKINFLRAKRKLVTSSFTWLSVAMHATTVFLLVFVVDIVAGFGKLVQNAGFTKVAEGTTGAGLPVTGIFGFSFANLELLQSLMLPIIIALSVMNALAPKLAEGGYGHKFYFNLSITLGAAGLALIVAPKITGAIFGVAATL